MDPQLIAFAVLLPAVCAGVVLGLAWKAWKRDAVCRWGRAGGGPALALAFFAAFTLLSGAPASFLPGAERAPASLDWLFWMVLLGAGLFSFEPPPSEKQKRPWRWAVAIAFAALVVETVLRSQFRNYWEGAQHFIWLSSLMLVFLVLWTSLRWLAERRTGASMPLVAWLSATGLALLASLSGSAKLGQLSGALAAGLGATVVLAWWRPRVSLAGGGAAITALVLFGIAANAHFYSYTLASDALLVASAPLAACFAELPLIRRKRAWSRTCLALLLAALPIGIALTRAALAFEPDPYADYK